LVTEIVYHDLFIKHELSPGHPESPKRVSRALQQIRSSGLLANDELQVVTPHKAELEDVYKIHASPYVESIRAMSERGGGFFTLDTSVNTHTYEAALIAAGAGIGAVDRIVGGGSQNAFVLCRPPGHHAEESQAFGFCFLNNIAIAASYLLNHHGLKRILILDYDAHHGNGTQNAFYSSSDVMYIGLHQDGRTLFPGSGFPNELGNGEGKGYNVNFSMYPGAGDVAYRKAFVDLIEPLVDKFRPEFILVSSGFDGHYQDSLTSLGLTTAGLAMMNRALNDMAQRICDGKLVFFLEGGYNLDVMGNASQNLIEELVGLDTTSFRDEHTESTICIDYTEELIKALRESLEEIWF
jgi:acetoin utilization deacetylase AcuC-like enzyme